MSATDWIMNIAAFFLGCWCASRKSKGEVYLKHGELEITAATVEDIEEILRALPKYNPFWVPEDEPEDETATVKPCGGTK